MKRLSNILMAAAISLAAVGTGVAIVKPGDLGDDAKTETADQPSDDSVVDDDPVVDDSPVDDSTTDDSAADVEDDPVISAPDDDADDDADATTSSSTTEQTDASETSDTTPTTDGAATETSSGGGQSGFDADGAADPVDTSNGLADTGGTSMILAGAALAAASLAIRRRSAA